MIARQIKPQQEPALPGRRREDRALPQVEPTHHERLRFAVCHSAHGWLHEYRDGVPSWATVAEAALFSDQRAAAAVAAELGGYTVNVLMKQLEGDA